MRDASTPDDEQMKRGYTHERYSAIIDNIRRYMPDASISGDVIVGFPGARGKDTQKDRL